MSDTDDGFDKEAEREKLREKLEAEHEARQATEHMSELLLKGATMTNHHCDQCGDPIFRYDGQEFCPTCEQTVEEMGAQADEGAADPGTDAGTTAAPADEAAEPADKAGVTTDPDAADGTTETDRSPTGERSDAADQPDVTPTDRSDTTSADVSNRPEAGGQPSARARHSDTASGSRAGTTRGERSEKPAPTPDATGDLGTARASLVRTLEDLSRRAEAAEDVRRTRDLLAAAREAAEALAALDRADR